MLHVEALSVFQKGYIYLERPQMRKTIERIFALLSEKERRKMHWLFFAMIIMAVMEVAGVGSIMPFMSMVANPDVIETNKWISWAYDSLRFESADRFLFFSGVFVLVILIINNSFTACITWLIFKFTWMCNHNLSRRLLAKYLYQPYIFYLNRNTSDLMKNILDEVRHFIAFVLLKLIMIIKNIVLTFFIFCFLLFIDPLLSLIVFMALGGVYAVFFSFINKTLNRIGKERAEANELRFKIAHEALSGIKELKVLRREDIFLNLFSIHSHRFANSQAMKSIISQLPKYAFEVIAFGGILLIVLFYIAVKRDIAQMIPLISLYAFAAYRLIPALQAIFTGLSEIRYNLPALDILHKDIIKNSGTIAYGNGLNNTIQPIIINEKIQLRNIYFTYPGMDEAIIQNFDLNIPVNTTVGLVGATGSGKTTIVDIILGLLTAEKGSLVIDHTVINEDNLVRWQKNIGYVSQDIFMYDDTIANNIAFGVQKKDINMKLIKNASQIANLHEFIINELPSGYDTIVGDRGVRLSGGQRQRIGIARAIYHEPQVLILDEATSALDGVTESTIIQAIHNLSHKKTIIMISHRLTTLKDCDIIYMIEHGKIKASGTYNELICTNVQFQNMAKLREPGRKRN